jgi:hypothetical protein
VKWLLRVALAALCLPLASFGVIGWFSRYAADDYCTASQVVEAGFIQAQSHLYVNWSGRFSATLLNTLFEVIGVQAVPLLALAAVLAWVVAAAWTIRQLAAPFGWRLDLLACATLGALLVYATLDTTADLPQDLYWQTGLLTYLLPLILATFFVGWIARHALGHASRAHLATALVPSFALAVVAGGTSETFAAAQVTALALGTAAAWALRNRRTGMLLFAALIGATIALAIIAVAPGNEVRQQATARTPLGIALPESMDFMLFWLRLTFARPHALVLALLIVLPACMATLSTRGSAIVTFRPLRVWPALLLGVLLVILACILPAYYALGTNPPGRAQLIPESVLLATVALVGWGLGGVAAHAIRRAVHQLAFALIGGVAVLALLVAGPGLSAWRSVGVLEPARAYAAEWDLRDAQIRADRARGVQSVRVPSLPATGSVQNLEWLGPDSSDWFNQCVAGYYGVSSIAASPGG